VDAAAVLVQGFVEVVLLGLGEVAAVLGFVGAFALGDVGVMLFVAGFLLGVDLAVGDDVLNAVLLVVQALVDFVDARMVGDRGGLGGLRQSGSGGGGSGQEQGHQGGTGKEIALHECFLHLNLVIPRCCFDGVWPWLAVFLFRKLEED